MVHRKISDGIDILTPRQKLVKLVDSSDDGWRVVQKYEVHLVANDSEDEKKINHPQINAVRKVKQGRRIRFRRYRLYGTVMGVNHSKIT